MTEDFKIKVVLSTNNEFGLLWGFSQEIIIAHRENDNVIVVHTPDSIKDIVIRKLESFNEFPVLQEKLSELKSKLHYHDKSFEELLIDYDNNKIPVVYLCTH